MKTEVESALRAATYLRAFREAPVMDYGLGSCRRCTEPAVETGHHAASLRAGSSSSRATPLVPTS